MHIGWRPTTCLQSFFITFPYVLISGRPAYSQPIHEHAKLAIDSVSVLSCCRPIVAHLVDALQALLTALASSGSGRDVCQAVETALPVLLERLSDNNSRLRDSARDALVALAQEPEGRGALRMQASQLCKLPRSQTAWRPVLAMLQLLQELVPLLGVAGTGAAARSSASDGSGGGFDLQELMAYVGAAFGSANADVRGAALRVAVVAAEAAGAAPVRRLLPQGMNPKMKEQVEQALGLDASSPQTAGEAVQGGGRIWAQLL